MIRGLMLHHPIARGWERGMPNFLNLILGYGDDGDDGIELILH